MTDFLLEAERYVEHYFQLFLPKTRCFHTFAITRFVVETCEELAAASDLDWSESEALFLAAWFHGTGFCANDGDRVDNSIHVFNEFIQDQNLSSGFSDMVIRLIRSTSDCCGPSSHLEQQLKDARDRHLASPLYAVMSQFHRQELSLCEGKHYSDAEWRAINISRLRNHQFYTLYAADHWDNQKHINLSELENGLH
ncbi:hypothetical protein WBG78_06415 [Chryseolinea sp. T2]|uniref:HD domain-containing protein n=1 Tax=Chryseolinea sp. T2 TaxID=3129255 RepID=UPI003077E63F